MPRLGVLPATSEMIRRSCMQIPRSSRGIRLPRTWLASWTTLSLTSFTSRNLTSRTKNFCHGALERLDGRERASFPRHEPQQVQTSALQPLDHLHSSAMQLNVSSVYSNLNCGKRGKNKI